MWFKELLNSLTSKIILSDKVQKKDIELFTEEFIKLLLKVSGSTIDPEILLGIIDGMYKRFGDKKNNSIPLKVFAEYLMGLAILHNKCNDDLAIYNSNFKKYTGTNLRKALGFIFLEVKDLHEIEANTFRELNYNVTVDMQNAFNIITTHSKNYGYDFSQQFTPFSGTSSFFDDWILNMQYQSNINMVNPDERRQATDYYRLVLQTLEQKSKTVEHFHLQRKLIIQKLSVKYHMQQLGSIPLEQFKNDLDNVALPDKYLGLFLLQLKRLREKSDYWVVEYEENPSQKILDAITASTKLCNTLTQLYQSYFINVPNDQELKEFKISCIRAINESRPELEKHRGCKLILGNILIGILSLGTGFLVNYVVTAGKSWLFFKETDTAIKLNFMEKNLNLVGAAPAA